MTFRVGAHADNLPGKHSGSEATHRRLKLMGASVVSTLWTPGTKHDRGFYERCNEDLGTNVVFVVRIGPSGKTTAENWVRDLDEFSAEVPREAVATHRLVYRVLNEVNHPDEGGWAPEEYVELLSGICRVIGGGAPVLCASAVSQGFTSGPHAWRPWYDRFCELGGLGLVHHVSAHLYAHYARDVGYWTSLGKPLWVTECGLAGGRDSNWLADLYSFYATKGVLGATAFIADGRANGAWDERYVLNDEECRRVGNTDFRVTEGPKMADVGEGFKKFARVLGQPLEDEKYHFAGTPQEASLAVFENGSAHWDKAANVVVGVRKSDSAVFVDYGEGVRRVQKV